MADERSNELRYFDALKRIAAYETPDQLRRGASREKPEWGIGFEEALEYAYENVLDEARRATKGRRRPQP